MNQPEPKGFGDAVLTAQPFVRNEPFLVHAGDTYIISRKATHLKTLLKVHEQLHTDAVFMVREVKNPQQYGVIEAEESEKGIYKVKKAIEKPDKPPTNLAIVPLYVFKSKIFKALERTAPGKGGELQLTDAIQKLIEWGSKVHAVQLNSSHIRLDVGSPEKYWKALQLSHKYAGEFMI
jgi:UTP--glucose-1-phosphate uridylyltransferase